VCVCVCVHLASCPWAYATLYLMWRLSPNSYNYALIIFANCGHLALTSISHRHTTTFVYVQTYIYICIYIIAVVCVRNCISLCVYPVIVLFAWFYYFLRCRSAANSEQRREAPQNEAPRGAGSEERTKRRAVTIINQINKTVENCPADITAL